MMDQQCIDSIINVISKSNMADLDFLNTEIRPITCEIDEDGKENIQFICLYMIICTAK